MIAKPQIGACVGDDQGRASRNHGQTEGVRPWKRVVVHADLRLKPDISYADDTEKADGSLQDIGGQARDLVEIVFGKLSEDRVALYRRQPAAFVTENVL